jgi:hypothetical protein
MRVRKEKGEIRLWVSERYIGHLVLRGSYKESVDVLPCRVEISV